MENLPEQIRKISEEFVENVREAFGKSLHSVILYGPAARGEMVPGKKVPSINYLVVVDDNTPSELARCSKYVKKWSKQLITMPLFLIPGYIKLSLDTFPLEFMDISNAYHVFYGEDILEDIDFDRTDVRNQCERELKGKLLHLRAEYLNLRGDKKGLMDLINRSLHTFRHIFNGALFLKEHEVPKETGYLLRAVTEEYELDASLFKKLTAVANGDVKIDEAEADELFDLYVEELDKMSHSIDEMSESGNEMSESGNEEL